MQAVKFLTRLLLLDLSAMQNAQALAMLQLQQRISFKGGAQLVNGYQTDESVSGGLNNNSSNYYNLGPNGWVPMPGKDTCY